MTLRLRSLVPLSSNRITTVRARLPTAKGLTSLQTRMITASSKLNLQGQPRFSWTSSWFQSPMMLRALEQSQAKLEQMAKARKRSQLTRQSDVITIFYVLCLYWRLSTFSAKNAHFWAKRSVNLDFWRFFYNFWILMISFRKLAFCPNLKENRSSASAPADTTQV